MKSSGVLDQDWLIASYTMSSWVIGVIKITWKLSERGKWSIIWRHHLPKQRNGGGQIGIAVQNIDTSNTSDMATNAEKSENVLHM